MRHLSKLQHIDIPLFFLTLLLSIIGLVTVFTTTITSDGNAAQDFWNHLLFLCIGFCAAAVLAVINPTIWLKPTVIAAIFAMTSLLLILVLIVGTGPGANRWIEIGPVNIQPSEITKLVAIILLAFGWTRSQRHLPRAIFVGVPISLFAILIWMQPSLGNTIILIGTVGITMLAMLPNTASVIGLILCGSIASIIGSGLWSPVFTPLEIFSIGAISITTLFYVCRRMQIPMVIIATTVLIALTMSAFSNWGWNNLLTDYQQQRVEAFANPDSDPLGSQWQVQQSKIAISSGGLIGRGLLQGTQTNSGLLPFAYTDFAYAAIAEQLGTLGSFSVLTVLGLIIMRIVHIANISRDERLFIIANGVAVIIGLNTTINVAMNLGLIPVTGVPLPLISYGGSAAITILLGIGLVQAIYIHEQTKSDYTKLVL